MLQQNHSISSPSLSLTDRPTDWCIPALEPQPYQIKLGKWPKDIRAKQAPETTNNESNTAPEAPAPIPPLAFLHPPKLHTTPVSRESSKMPGAWINGVLWPRETTKTLLLQLILLLSSSSSSSSNRTSSSFSCSSSSASSSFSSSCHLPYTTAKCTIKRSQKLHKCGENTREERERAGNDKGRATEREKTRGGEGEEVEEEEKGRILGAGNERGINLGLVPN